MYFHCTTETLMKWLQMYSGSPGHPCNFDHCSFQNKTHSLNSYFSWLYCTTKTFKSDAVWVLTHWLIDLKHSNGLGQNDVVAHHRDSNINIIYWEQKPEHQKHFPSPDLNDETTFADRLRMNRRNSGCTAPSHARATKMLHVTYSEKRASDSFLKLFGTWQDNHLLNV